MKEVFKNKWLYIIIAFVILLFAIIFYAGSIIPGEEKTQLAQDYITGMQCFYQDYISEQNLEIKIDELRSGLMQISVPSEYRDSHLELVLLINKIENLMAENDLESLEGSLKELENKLKSY